VHQHVRVYLFTKKLLLFTDNTFNFKSICQFEKNKEWERLIALKLIFKFSSALVEALLFEFSLVISTSCVIIFLKPHHLAYLLL